MGNSFSCFEKDGWDSHGDVDATYPVSSGDKVYMDMTQPLSHYFISSGHNSYLTGNQVTDDAGTSTIELCLRHGCRVIELDVYNKSGKYTEPICKHGGTLTKPVAFRACIKAIATFAFIKSPYPVIVTLENHTDMENQAMLAKILREELQDKLYVPGPDEVKAAAYKSPEELRGKVLVRASLKHEVHPDYKALVYIVNTKLKKFGSPPAEASSASFPEDNLPKIPEYSDDSDDEDEKQAKESAKARIAALLPGKAPVLSMSPSEVTDALEGTLYELLNYTSGHLMRVYPAGWRIDSSNYNPIHAWSRGASLAALNWQQWAKPMWVNQAMFSDNGGCGYVLKPEWMRKPALCLPSRTPQRLTVTIHSAFRHQDKTMFCMRDDIFVQIEIIGLPMDCKRVHTKTSVNSGRLVVDETWSFDVRFPEMALVSVQLRDEDADHIKKTDADTLAHFTLPLKALQSGSYRLPLLPAKHCSVIPFDADKCWIKAKFELGPAPPSSRTSSDSGSPTAAADKPKSPDAAVGASGSSALKEVEPAVEAAPAVAQAEEAQQDANPLYAAEQKA